MAFLCRPFLKVNRISLLGRMRLHKSFSSATDGSAKSVGSTASSAGRAAVAAFSIAAAFGLAFQAGLLGKSKDETNESVEDEMERRLNAELKQTSFKEWRAAGFDPEVNSEAAKNKPA
eukprot:TRINITY_DN97824_c0_g1_i1.p1 TRINITY_DN97824_c0_g1~~TRINITY_DN97824_c0_g1_i1.p1  ORF type:complete len:118 (-),score=23.92 TRINITY_DN97824_c0_g1_i1:126-479(-)